MQYLLDTGILVRLPHRSDPLNAEIRAALSLLKRNGHRFVTTTQNIAEFWNVCTRPAAARGGFGLTIEEAAYRLRLIERLVRTVREPESAYSKWKNLLLTLRVSGRQVHDARIAASMNAFRIKRILTFNGADFQRYPKVEPMTPQQVLAAKGH